MIVNKPLRKCTAVCILLSICSVLCICASASDEQHWYCKRTKDHTQPLLDADMQWIEEFDGIYVDKAHNDACNEKVVYLTFDAGYENGNVEIILDVLERENVSAAFFILEHLLDKNPNLVQRMATQGHLVCNHTSTHKDITKLSDEQLLDEINRLEKAYYELTGQRMPKYFRPPEGTFDRKSLSVLKDHGYTTVFWSFAYADWDNARQMNPDTAIKKVMENLHNGEIILLHPTSATNAQILGDVIRDIKAQGYRFGTLDEICS